MRRRDSWRVIGCPVAECRADRFVRCAAGKPCAGRIARASRLWNAAYRRGRAVPGVESFKAACAMWSARVEAQ